MFLYQLFLFFLNQLQIFSICMSCFSLLLLFVFHSTLSKGDFQWFPPLSNIDDPWKSQFQLLPSSSTIDHGWYSINYDNVEVRKKYNVVTTNCIDLTTDYPTSICQKVQLQIGKKYRLGYSLYCDQKFQKMVCTVKINNIIASFLYIPTNSTFGQKFDFFYAEHSVNQICFSQTHQIAPLYAGTLTYYWGGLLDNVTLEQVFFHVLLFIVQTSENMSFIVLKSNLSFDQFQTIEQFQRQYILEYDEASPVQIIYNYSYSRFYSIGIYSKVGFSVDLVRFLPKITLDGSEIIRFQIKISEFTTFFRLNQRQQNLLQDLETIASFIVENLNFCIRLIRYSLLAHFVINFLGFPYLSLFYIFLNLQTIPEFIRQLYYELLRLTLVDQSLKNLLEKIGIMFPQIRVDKEDEIVRQVVLPNIENYKWFGSYKISSLVVNNNIDMFIIIGLFFIKMMVVAIAIAFCNKLTSKSIKKPNYLQFFLMQVSANSPTICISALSRTIFSCNGQFQYYQKFIQILLLFLCIMIPPIFYIYISKQTFKKQNTNKGKKRLKNQKEEENQRKKLKQFYQNLSSTILFVVLPFGICLNDPLTFLTLTSILSFVRTIILLNYIGYTATKIEKANSLLSHTSQVIHHFLFFSLYLISKKSAQQIQRGYGQTIISIGLALIICVISIWVFQTTKILINLINFLTSLRDWIKNTFMRSPKKIHPKIRIHQPWIQKNQKLILEIEELKIQVEEGKQKSNSKDSAIAYGKGKQKCVIFDLQSTQRESSPKIA